MIKKIIYNTIRFINKITRYDVYSKNSDKDILLNNFYSILKSIQYEPIHVLDIGANKGTWTRHMLKFFPNSQYSLFEPQYWMKENVIDILNSNIKFYPFGMGDKKDTLNFTIVERDDSCNFLMSEVEAKNLGYNQIKVDITTVNDFIKEGKLKIPDFIKIDAEGLDLKVLKGASDCFGITEVFMVEVGVSNSNFDNSVLNVVKFMDENGYKMFEITDLNRPFSSNILWLMEIAFIKKNGFIDSYKWDN